MVLFSDHDGTFASKDDPTVLSGNLLAVHHWRNRGHKFVIVTGRNHAVINDILPNWQEYVDYLIMDNGGAIFSQQDQLVHIFQLKRSLIRDIQSFVCDRALPISYSAERCSIELLLGEKAIKLRLYFKSQTWFERYQAHLEAKNWPIKVLPWPKPGFSKLPSGKDPSQFYGFLDIVPQNSGKECAIQWLIDTQYPTEQIITVGDDYNDIAMLSQYQGFAITGSPTEVVTAAQGRTVKSVAELIYSHL